MREKRLILICQLILVHFLALAQAPKELANINFAFKGKLVNANAQQPVEFATVSIFNEGDSTLATGGLTDVNGAFNIPIEKGAYYLRVQFMGFQDILISNISINRDTPIYNTGDIEFKENETLLEEVVVQAERTQMEMTLDKKVFNIGKDLSNLGGSATDILDSRYLPHPLVLKACLK
ncbi:MAG: carboxypeptidase-like regulatory domain-containing protein, partial [Bacteroidota bacterium]